MTKVSSWTAELFSLLIMRDVLWVLIMHLGVTEFIGLGMHAAGDHELFKFSSIMRSDNLMVYTVSTES